MNNASGIPFKAIGIIAAIVMAILTTFYVMDFETIRGNEIGVKETFGGGVDETPLSPRTYFRNRFTTDIYHYDMSSKSFAMNDIPRGEDERGRQNDAYILQTADQQTATLYLQLRYHKDPAKIVHIHKTYFAHVDNDLNPLEDRLIRPALMLTVKNHATKMKAMEMYSGEGLVRLQTEIEQDLLDPNGDLRNNGVIVDSFVIERTTLDEKYVAEITARQIAQQKTLRANEEKLSADAEALKAKAVAQADYNVRVVQAEKDKAVAILQAQQESESAIIAARAANEKIIMQAKADAEKIILAANAEKESSLARAAAIEALGKANAEAKKLEFSAYGAAGANLYAQIEISRNMGTAFSGIKGYLPEKLSTTLLTTNFLDSVRSLMNPPEPLPVK